MWRAGVMTLLWLAVSACAPEPGSKDWCADMDEKPKGDWSMNEATEYASSCVFQSDDD